MSVITPISLLFRGLVLYSFLFVPRGFGIYTGFVLYNLALIGNIVHFLYYLEQVLGVFRNKLLYTFLYIFYSNTVSFLYIYNFLVFTEHSTFSIKWLVAVLSLCLGSLILDLTHIINKWSNIYFKIKDINIEETSYSSSDDEDNYVNDKKNN